MKSEHGADKELFESPNMQWKQVTQFVAGVTGALVAFFISWRVVPHGDPYLGAYPIALIAPALGLGAGAGWLVGALVTRPLLGLIYKSAQGKPANRVFTTINSLGIGVSLTSTILGAALTFSPLGWFYQIPLARLCNQQLSRKIAAACELSDEKAVEELRQLLKTSRAGRKEMIAQALCCDLKTESDAALNDVLDLMYGDYGLAYAGNRYPYCRCLINMAPRAMVLAPRLIRTLSTPPGISEEEWKDLRLVEFSARMLGAMGEEGRIAIPELERAAANYGGTADSEDRLFCLRALEDLDADCDVFVRLMKSSFSDTRKEAFSILTKRCKELADAESMTRVEDVQTEVRAHDSPFLQAGERLPPSESAFGERSASSPPSSE